MKVQTSVKAGGSRYQHAQTIVVKTGVRAGGQTWQHAQTQARR
jgi:hypothetical protein